MALKSFYSDFNERKCYYISNVNYTNTQYYGARARYSIYDEYIIK